MSALLELREKLRNIYSKGEVYITPFSKFLLSLIAFLCINANIGYMGKLNNTMIAIVLALIGSLLPLNLTVLICGGMVCAHLYALSLECGIVGAAVIILMFVFYFRFSPSDSAIVLLLPICFGLKIPYVIPIAAGLLCTPLSVVSVACGTIAYYVITYFKENSQTIATLDAENAVAKFRFVIDGVLGNKEMFVTVIAFAAMVLVVYLLRRLSIDHSWTIGMVAGIIFGVVILLVGSTGFKTDISIGGLILGMIVSFLICKVLEFFMHNVNYSRTEYVQFEDDEYYYYVKAVPKNSVKREKKKVKKITSAV